MSLQSLRDRSFYALHRHGFVRVGVATPGVFIADPARNAAVLEAWLADLPPIPGPMHWVMMISGVGCLGVGINMAVGRLGVNADDQEPEHDAYPRP